MPALHKRQRREKETTQKFEESSSIQLENSVVNLRVCGE